MRQPAEKERRRETDERAVGKERRERQKSKKEGETDETASGERNKERDR